jgi:hypothetical protein
VSATLSCSGTHPEKATRNCRPRPWPAACKRKAPALRTSGPQAVRGVTRGRGSVVLGEEILIQTLELNRPTGTDADLVLDHQV